MTAKLLMPTKKPRFKVPDKVWSHCNACGADWPWEFDYCPFDGKQTTGLCK